MGYADTGTLHVLVIDDDADLRALLSTSLLAEGHHVVSCGAAEEGLETLPYGTFDVALLDHQLPGMEGLVFGEYLRRNNPEMAIALVTGSADERIARQAEADGIRLFPKPFDVDEIIDFVEAARQRIDEQQRAKAVAAGPRWETPLADHLGALADLFDLPSVPRRLEERLVWRIQQALAALRMTRGANPEERAAAYAGLVTARVLGVRLPPNKDEESPYEEYDRLMSERGGKPEFTTG